MRLTRTFAGALLAVTLAACSGDDAVGRYVTEIAAATAQMTRDSFAALPPGAAPTREQIEGVVAARQTALDAIARLSAPDEMRPEHLALTTTMAGFVAATEGFLAETAGLDPGEFLAALEASSELDALADTVSAACTAWERRAGELGHATELGC
ncbi:MAG TPA: hypothetical protein VJA44_09230 [Acidimicrobiia bacterium]|nr:hypothetical protein [Acidimicrobiia bacterium]